MIQSKSSVSQCFYSKGISAIHIPFYNDCVKWDILRIEFNPYRITSLMPTLRRFIKRCHLWTKALRWARRPRALLSRELTGKLPCPNHCPLLRNLKRLGLRLSSSLPLVEPILLSEPQQHHSRMPPNHSVNPETTSGPSLQ